MQATVRVLVQSAYTKTPPRVSDNLLQTAVTCVDSAKGAQERATRVKACNYVKIETGRNFPPVLKIVTRTVQAA